MADRAHVRLAVADRGHTDFAGASYRSSVRLAESEMVVMSRWPSRLLVLAAGLAVIALAMLDW